MHAPQLLGNSLKMRFQNSAQKITEIPDLVCKAVGLTHDPGRAISSTCGSQIVANFYWENDFSKHI